MAALEAEQQREEAALLAGAPVPASTAASTPPNPADPVASLSVIGSGIKSMPASRRPSGGKDDLSYHLSKLAVSPAPGSNALGVAGAGGRASLDGSASKANGNEPFSPGFAGKFVFDDDDTSAPGESSRNPPVRSDQTTRPSR